MSREKVRGKMGQRKAKRYWPGKAPEWADEDGDIRVEAAFPTTHDDVTRKGDDPRLSCRIDHRRAEIISISTSTTAEEKEKLEERRIRIREKLLQRQQEESEELEEEEESDSEEEEEVTMGIAAMVKPVFVPKKSEIAEAEERSLEEEAVKRNLELRKKETKEMVIEKIKEDHREIHKNVDMDMDTDDDDDMNEYEAWKSREITRIKRDRKKAEIDKVRNMTQEEEEWGRKNPKQSEKKCRRFMQKYYHKGAFFQDDDDRDYSGDDKMDKSILPKVMQVKDFGRTGRSKWTHLLDQDTTHPWTYNDPLRPKYNQKMAGMNTPKGSKKLKDWDLGVTFKVLKQKPFRKMQIQMNIFF